MNGLLFVLSAMVYCIAAQLSLLPGPYLSSPLSCISPGTVTWTLRVFVSVLSIQTREVTRESFLAAYSSAGPPRLPVTTLLGIICA